MKKGICLVATLLMVLFCAAALADVEINETNFPDSNFRQFIMANTDTDGDGVLSESELNAVKTIDCSGKSISDLKGIEHFTALTELDCRENNLTNLDVSQNTALVNLYCSSNKLSSLDVGNNLQLEGLGCGNNQLTSLDTSKNASLESLGCSNNKLTKLTLSNNQLCYLACEQNNIKELDISGCRWLITIYDHGKRYDEGSYWYYEYKENLDEYFTMSFDKNVKIVMDGSLPGVGDQFTVGFRRYEVKGKNKVSFIGLANTHSHATNVYIPDSIKYCGVTWKITAISKNALYKNKEVITVIIDENVTKIGEQAFAKCSKLKKVEGCKGVKTICAEAFSGCSSLTSFPEIDKLQTIENNAFRNCNALKKFTLGKNVKSIGKSAFNGCKALKTITVKTAKLTDSNVKASAFKGIHKKATFKCPKDKLKEYKKLFGKKGAPKTCKFK